ncbi:G-type lectin S-receptor-like serine/threonine-protein kinase At5g35370 [Fagus crenata]
MGYCLLFPTIFLVFPLVFGLSSEFIYPNFTASEFQLIDRNGVFLSSRNGSFAAAIFKPHPQQTNFYLCVIHMASNTTIWSANRDTPISNSGILNLTTKGITISDQDGNLRWSTPPLLSSVNALLLTEMGNLVLLDHSNSSLWESFHHPTDTIVIGQRLPVGTYLSSAVSEYDLSSGDHNFTISTSDALLQWYGQTYWKLSMDTKAYINSNYEVKYMTINRTGLYLLGHNASLVVIQVILSPADFRIAKLDPSGKFNVRSYSDTNWVQEFSGPDDNCKIPSFCHRMGLCTDDTPSNTPTCSCPPGFHVGSQNISGCVPGDGSYSLPFACNSANNGSRLNSSVVAYLGLGSGIDYFANDFSESLKYVVNLSVCQDLCSGDCSCLGIFYGNSSGSCSVIKNELGSVISSNSGGRDWLGYIKVSGSHTANPTDSRNQNQRHPTVYLVLLPFTSFFLLVAVGYLLWRRWALYKTKEINLGCCNSHSSEELDAFYIPGLPKRKNCSVRSQSHNMDDSSSGGGHSSSSSGSELVYYPLFALEMHEQGKYLELADPRLEGRVTMEEVEKLARVALCCLHEEPALRPNMVSVVGMLEGGMPLDQPRTESLNFLRFYGRRFIEASTIMDPNGSLSYPQANSLQTGFSFLSSQQISGPR